jgi:signal transduction histidine kinase
MSLRTQILVYVVAVMSIVFTLVAATLIPDRILSQRYNLKLGQESAHSLAALLESLSEQERRELLNTRPRVFLEESILRGWVLATESGDLVTSRMPEVVPKQLTADIVKKMDFDDVQHFKSRSGEGLVLYSSINRQLLEPTASLWQIFAVMAFGTVMLLVVIYTLMLRLIVKPVERLAKASHATAAAGGLIAVVPHTDRKDEIGELVRAYNRMAGEVNDLRLNLEKRVEEATRDLKAAQSQIVLSDRLSMAGRLAAGVAHEINNPLGGMINAARTLKSRAPSGGKEGEYLEVIVEGLSRIQGIVSAMLQFSRPVQQAAAVDLREVIDNALLFCRHRIEQKQVKLEKDFDSNGATFSVTGHRSELGQVFLNLMVNALDAMEAAGTRSHTLTLRLRKEGAEILASVADTGTGMTPEVKERAGQFFYSTKAEGKGTGLGLAVVQHIVLQQQGTMAIDSIEGSGTTVTVRLPIPVTQ